MKKRDRKALGQYIRGCADMLELRDWGFTLEYAPCEDGNLATVTIVYGRKLAQIRVCEDFRERDLDEQRHTIAHELVHCHLEGACGMVRDDLEEHIGAAADKLFWDAFKRQMEYGVDALASAIAPRLPVIDWPASR